ncbi:hypothetical protein ACFO3O_03615 [Dokdonia ponticola]|uniref:Uncharacterized protein n=1 Tax=Dokdonia ponticola TaxID=2041041 RepID=A0ABV9HS57_9FLAO
MNFYEKLLSYKALNKLSWKEIGDIIGKEQATIRIAVTRESLSELEIREIENIFFKDQNSDIDNIESSTSNYAKLIKVGKHKITIDDFVSALINNTALIEDHPSYIILKDSIKEKAKRDYLEELYRKQQDNNSK